MSPRPKRHPSRLSSESARPSSVAIATALQGARGEKQQPSDGTAPAGRTAAKKTPSRASKSAIRMSAPTSSERAVVPSAEEMDDETFFKHYNARHVPNDATGAALRYSPTLTAGLIGTTRAWHRRMHLLAEDGDFTHEHLED